MPAAYHRILLKLSGEALMGDDAYGINRDTIKRIVGEIGSVAVMGVEIAVVIGGGNIFRGVAGTSTGMDRATADYMGMLATVMNSLAVADALERLGLGVRVQTAIVMQAIAEPYIRNRAVRHMEKGRIVILACGTGNPFFSTDTASALRGAEINADIFFKATMVDGVYDKDPKKHADAVRYEQLTFTEVLNKKLQVMDSTAATLCRDNALPILVFDINDPDNIARALAGEAVGTLVKED